jgi:hypothetical protein
VRLCAATDNRRRMRSADTRDNAEQVLNVSDGSKPEKLNASICFPLCTLRADIAQCSRHVRFVPIVLQKSFC